MCLVNANSSTCEMLWPDSGRCNTWFFINASVMCFSLMAYVLFLDVTPILCPALGLHHAAIKPGPGGVKKGKLKADSGAELGRVQPTEWDFGNHFEDDNVYIYIFSIMYYSYWLLLRSLIYIVDSDSQESLKFTPYIDLDRVIMVGWAGIDCRRDGDFVMTTDDFIFVPPTSCCLLAT